MIYGVKFGNGHTEWGYSEAGAIAIAADYRGATVVTEDD